MAVPRGAGDGAPVCRWRVSHRQRPRPLLRRGMAPHRRARVRGVSPAAHHGPAARPLAHDGTHLAGARADPACRRALGVPASRRHAPAEAGCGHPDAAAVQPGQRGAARAGGRRGAARPCLRADALGQRLHGGPGRERADQSRRRSGLAPAGTQVQRRVRRARRPGVAGGGMAARRRPGAARAAGAVAAPLRLRRRAAGRGGRCAAQAGGVRRPGGRAAG
ncbi:hypothetical protein D3C72_1276240 [compost metagenome]